MMASKMIQVATLASGIFPTNIVCTSTWSGLSVNERENTVLMNLY